MDAAARQRTLPLGTRTEEGPVRYCDPGAKVPYTSMNGNVYSYLGENGVGLGLPADTREDFLKKCRTTLYHTHGIVQKEYVSVPAELLAKTTELTSYFRASFDYARTLKPKPTERTPKS